jgi:hypothetical protein
MSGSCCSVVIAVSCSSPGHWTWVDGTSAANLNSPQGTGIWNVRQAAIAHFYSFLVGSLELGNLEYLLRCVHDR